MTGAAFRIGIDLGGTKVEGLLIDKDGSELARRRIPTPRNDYDATLAAIAELVRTLETEAGARDSSVGIAIPGSVSRRTGRVHNANSTWINGRDFESDIASVLGRPASIANDANCFALSEATDGSAAGAASVFGIIIGTGTGGGLVYKGQLIDGPLGIGGEWGHNPLPWPGVDEYPGPQCWCGRVGCMETWVSGPAIAADHARMTGQHLSAEAVEQAARAGGADAQATLERHLSRLARGIAHVVNIFDPNVIVLGGGLSKMPHLYSELPDRVARHVFADCPAVTILPPKWGDASGVRGAAWLGGPA